ncbi:MULTISPECIES: DUF6807 domain-containing protein [Catenuloplanes]|uniref:Oxidoreductase n=1 Tax=Catenuloplanes niger TaxID=587534 RepID=A0AAE4CSX5_9ACTN|nr:PmoA family protein [Catenuloplanes niger]MDR7320174.1 hypothetical protein [Catenuloplanes niger]
MTASVRLASGDTDVAEYVWDPAELPRTVSPRPFLHPVRTLSGVRVTDVMPGDHLHHLGVSIAVPDLAGHNFWGGRTFVRTAGPRPLDNHGVQRHDRWDARTADAVEARLVWHGADGGSLVRERRRIAVLPLPAWGCWALDVAFTLENVTAEPLSFASPAVNGRPGAGYGGFFWRAPSINTGTGTGTGTGTTVASAFGPDRRGVRWLHGRTADWLALCGHGAGRTRWSLLFVPADERTRADPWFVRTGDYAGVGSCLAWERPLVVPAGETLSRRIITVVADGTLGVAEAAELSTAALQISAR